jgi:hypothetical protein
MRFTTNSPPGGFFPHLSRPLNATAPPPLQRPAHRTVIVAKRDRPAMMDGRRLTLPPPDVFPSGHFFHERPVDFFHSMRMPPLPRCNSNETPVSY